MRRSMYLRALQVLPALGLLAAMGCGSGGGGGSSGASQQGVTGATSSAHLANPNRAQWNVALAALSGVPPPQPVTFEQPAFDAWNDLITRGWPEIRRVLDPLLTNGIVNQIGSLAGSNGITSI